MFSRFRFSLSQMLAACGKKFQQRKTFLHLLIDMNIQKYSFRLTIFCNDYCYLSLQSRKDYLWEKHGFFKLIFHLAEFQNSRYSGQG
jgi:hypothetical protein